MNELAGSVTSSEILDGENRTGRQKSQNFSLSNLILIM